MGAYSLPTKTYLSIVPDEGMINLVNKGYSTLFYLKGAIKSYFLEGTQELDNETEYIKEMILDKIEESERYRILDLIKKNKVYLFYGTEFQRVFSNLFKGKRRVITKTVVSLYVEGLDYCPSLYGMKTEIQNIDISQN